MVTPSACRRFISANSASVSPGVSVAVGSSMISRRARRASALAISTSCFSATINSRTGVSGWRFKPDLIQHLLRAGAHRVVVEQAAAAADLVAEVDVLRDRQVLGEVELLVDQHDAGGLGLARADEAPLLSVDRDAALGRRFVAGEDLHQRGLAGAVFAEQADHTTRRELEAHVVQHAHRTERLADAVESRLRDPCGAM